MYCELYLKRIIPFLTMFLVGLQLVGFSKLIFSETKISPTQIPVKQKILVKEKPKIYSDKKASSCGWSVAYKDKDGTTKIYDSQMANEDWLAREELAKKDELARIKLAKKEGKYNIPATAIKILSKPKPGYTKEARENNVWGVMRLKVTFSANGNIGGVSTGAGYIGGKGLPVVGLPYGLTEQAIKAARKIKFKPPTRFGKPYTVTKTVQYNFNLY